MKISYRSLAGGLAAVAVWLSASVAHAQHGHLNAGAVGTNQDDALFFANGADFVTNSGYIVTMAYTNAGTYAGYFNVNLTITALPATSANGGPDPDAAALGAKLAIELTSVTGPSGATFSFWQGGVPVVSLQSGQTGTGTWLLSGAAAGAPGADPFGHIHGRRFTVDQPGLYTIGFTLYDISTNGIGSGPIHAPSETLYVNFLAVPEPGTLALVGGALVSLVLTIRRRRTS
ncbi:MAG: hypothetical protein PCFJNLEI_02273 [Verrucomicrobiae bacterium]|nr:hypothetical protein [Verrucomicrobiae bacterium]